jgi:tRNA(Arg) A34 adenosine deaminase TadA
MFPQREIPTKLQIRNNLVKTIKVAHRIKNEGHHPFGSILVGPDNETVILEQGNIDTLNHAESILCKTAFEKYSQDYLWRCTLYTNFEPCAMCAGSIYWSNIGRVVYGLSEKALLELTGDNKENMTLSMPCRNIFNSGQKDIQVVGPVADLENEEELKSNILKDHVDFWK